MKKAFLGFLLLLLLPYCWILLLGIHSFFHSVAYVPAQTTAVPVDSATTTHIDIGKPLTYPEAYDLVSKIRLFATYRHPSVMARLFSEDASIIIQLPDKALTQYAALLPKSILRHGGRLFLSKPQVIDFFNHANFILPYLTLVRNDPDVIVNHQNNTAYIHIQGTEQIHALGFSVEQPFEEDLILSRDKDGQVRIATYAMFLR